MYILFVSQLHDIEEIAEETFQITAGQATALQLATASTVTVYITSFDSEPASKSSYFACFSPTEAE